MTATLSLGSILPYLYRYNSTERNRSLFYCCIRYNNRRMVKGIEGTRGRGKGEDAKKKYNSFFG